MFEIEYQLTIEDDLNSWHTRQLFIANLPLLHWQNNYILPLMSFIVQLPYLWQCITTDIPLSSNSQDVSIFSIVFNLVSILFLFPQVIARFTSKFTNWLPKYNIKKSWKENPYQIKERKLIITKNNFILVKSQEFLFIEETQTNYYPWEEIQYFLDGKLGFILAFPKEKFFFIPKRIFTDKKELIELTDILYKNGKEIKNRTSPTTTSSFFC